MWQADGGCSSAAVTKKLNELPEELERKACADEVPTTSQFVKLQTNVESKLKELAAEVESKANCREVVTLTQMQKLIQTVDRKVNASKVPSLVQFNTLAATVEGKINADLCPTASQVEDLEALVKCSMMTPSQLQKLTDDVARKANVVDMIKLKNEMNEKFDIITRALDEEEDDDEGEYDEDSDIALALEDYDEMCEREAEVLYTASQG